jgi:hypothetical protein
VIALALTQDLVLLDFRKGRTEHGRTEKGIGTSVAGYRDSHDTSDAAATAI